MRFPASDLFFRICRNFWKNLKQAQKKPGYGIRVLSKL